MALPAASVPPVPTNARAASPESHGTRQAYEDAAWGAKAVLAISVVAALAVSIMPQRPLAVWVAVGLAVASALVAIPRHATLAVRFPERQTMLAGVNALLGGALFALPFVLNYRGRFALFTIVFGFWILCSAGSALLLALDHREPAGTATATGASARRKHRRARPGG